MKAIYKIKYEIDVEIDGILKTELVEFSSIFLRTGSIKKKLELSRFTYIEKQRGSNSMNKQHSSKSRFFDT